MAKLKFELFVTTSSGQQTFELDQKPIMFGSGPNCDVKMGHGEPTVKAILQKEDEVLLIKVFDIAYPISINGKKYKTAKLKNSSFFKIGNIDIVANIEEVVDVAQEEILDEFSEDTGRNEIFEDYVEEERSEPSSSVFTAPSLAAQMQASHSQPESLPEEKAIEATNTNIKVAKLLHGDLPVVSPQVAQENKQVVNLSHNVDEDDYFKFDIHFNEESYAPMSMANYSDKNYDYSDYIDPKDETIKELPEEILEEIEGHCIHIVHMNNGVTIEEEHFAPQAKRIYVSNEFSDKKTIQVLDCEEYKSELVFVRDRKVFVVGQKGYLLQKVDDLDNVINIETATVQLINGERVILSKGTSQIVVSIVKTPPRLIHKNFFDFDDELVKITAMVWATCIVPLLLIMLLAEMPQQKPKVKKELVVIYKKKKIKKPEKKEVEKPKEAAQAEPVKAEQKKAEPVKAPEKKVAEKKPVKKVEKIVKKVAQENPVKKKVTEKVAKVKAKAPKVSNKVAKQKSIAKPAPKKTYKFSSSSKLSAVMGSNNTKLKTARTTSSVDVASTMGSTSSLTQSYNANKFGKSGVRVETFGSGSPNGSKAGIGTSGLSGKRGASTAYIEANTKILGAMDPELIRKIMKEYIPQFRYCYQQEIMRSPSAEGTFDLEFKINAYGKGIDVGVRKNGQDFSRKATNCLKRVVKMIKFPKPKGGGLVDVRQPMNFYKQ